MPEFRDLVKHLVEFGVPLNETSSLGSALNVLLIRGSYVFNHASEVNQDQMVFLVSDLLARGADLTQRISDTTMDPPYFDAWDIGSKVHKIHCSGSYLYAVTKRNIHDGMYVFLCIIRLLAFSNG